MKEVLLTVAAFSLGLWTASEYLTTEKRDEHYQGRRELLLTPLILKGDLHSARKQSLVGPPFNRKFMKSYSGFITVNDTCRSNLFFWFFLSQNNPSADPVILFLEGGPGNPSSAEVFEGIGPFSIHDTLFLQDNPYTWNHGHSVLYIDSPVRTGFSFTSHDNCYSETLQEVSENLYQFLKQFYILFEEYKSNPLFLSGVNYSAKDALLLAKLIDERNTTDLGLNLKGLILGSPLIDPMAQLDRSEFLYQLGFVDRDNRDILAKEAMGFKERWMNRLHKVANPYIFRDHSAKIRQTTGGVSSLNYRKNEEDDLPSKKHLKLFWKPQIRHALHVGNAEFSDTDAVESALRWTLMESVKDHLEYLLDRYDVLVYVGQLDATVTYTGLARCLHGLNWTDAEEYRSSPRFAYKLRGEKDTNTLIKNFGHLFESTVRKAGHHVSKDNPGHLQLLVRMFTERSLAEYLWLEFVKHPVME